MSKLKYCLIILAFLPLLSLNSKVSADEPFLGEVRWFAGSFNPRGWANCDGSLLPIAQYSALFSLLGTNYGGDGRTTFGLPDMRGRIPVHAGRGPGLSDYRLGSKGGAEQTAISISNMPAHSHALNAVAASGAENGPNGNLLAIIRRAFSAEDANSSMASGSIGSAGSGVMVNNMQPFLGIRCIIAVQGLFPSRS